MHHPFHTRLGGGAQHVPGAFDVDVKPALVEVLILIVPLKPRGNRQVNHGVHSLHCRVHLLRLGHIQGNVAGIIQRLHIAQPQVVLGFQRPRKLPADGAAGSGD
jgi:hypothetical protein